MVDKHDYSHCHVCGCVLTDANRCSGGNRKIWCRDCANRLNRAYKKRRRNDQNDSYREQERIRAHIYYNAVGRKNRDDWLAAYRTACLKCGDNRPWVLVWHHVYPYTKKMNISAGTPRKDKQAEIIEETKKCVNLCANCHREFHHIYGVKMAHPKESLEDYLGFKLKEEVK